MFDREKAIATIEAGGCACPGCRGQLTAADLSPGGWAFCGVCRCAWKIQETGAQQYATSIHAPIHTPPRPPLRQPAEADYDGHEDLR
jgi:hypothetical protein